MAATSTWYGLWANATQRRWRGTTTITPAAGGGGAATDLGVTRTAASATVTSSTGTDAVIPLADFTNAGLMSPAAVLAVDNALQSSLNLQDLSDVGEAKASLGLGSAAEINASVVGANLLTAATAAAALSVVGGQPVNAGLTAISALTTTTFGRSLLTLAAAADGRTSLGVPGLTTTNQFTLGAGNYQRYVIDASDTYLGSFGGTYGGLFFGSLPAANAAGLWGGGGQVRLTCPVGGDLAISPNNDFPGQGGLLVKGVNAGVLTGVEVVAPNVGVASSGRPFRVRREDGSVLFGIGLDGAMTATYPTLADAAAVNGQVYFGSDWSGKLMVKTSAGIPIPLHD
jgi:hypothetical protein